MRLVIMQEGFLEHPLLKTHRLSMRAIQAYL